MQEIAKTLCDCKNWERRESLSLLVHKHTMDIMSVQIHIHRVYTYTCHFVYSQMMLQ